MTVVSLVTLYFEPSRAVVFHGPVQHLTRSRRANSGLTEISRPPTTRVMTQPKNCALSPSSSKQSDISQLHSSKHFVVQIFRGAASWSAQNVASHDPHLPFLIAADARIYRGSLCKFRSSLAILRRVRSPRCWSSLQPEKMFLSRRASQTIGPLDGCLQEHLFAVANGDTEPQDTSQHQECATSDR